MPRFGEQRMYSESRARRLQFQLTGVLDPAHTLHHRYLRAALDSQRGMTPRAILDAGCGGGDHSIYLARRFPGAQVLGVDMNEAGIARNTATAEGMGIRNLTFAVADLATLRRSVPQHTDQPSRTVVTLPSLSALGRLRSADAGLDHIRHLRLGPQVGMNGGIGARSQGRDRPRKILPSSHLRLVTEPVYRHAPCGIGAG